MEKPRVARGPAGFIKLTESTSLSRVVVVQCGPGFKLALATGEEGFGCLSPVCGDCQFHIVKLCQSRALSDLICTCARGWGRAHDDDWHNTLQWTVQSFFFAVGPKTSHPSWALQNLRNQREPICI